VDEVNETNTTAAEPEKTPRKRAPRRATAVAGEVTAVSAAEHVNASDAGVPAVSADKASGDAEAAPAGPRRRGRPSKAAAAEAEASASSDSKHAGADAAGTDGESAEGERPSRNRNRSRGRNRNESAAEGDDNNGDTREGREPRDGREGREPRDRDDRQGRNRQRDRRRGRQNNDDVEPEILDDDVLIPIAGILDILDNYAFVRTSGYLPGTNDVYVSLGQVKKYNLRKGDAIVGAIKQPREGENFGRQKYNALVKIDSINAQSIEQAATRVDFQKLTPLYPNERMRMETGADKLTQRVIDIVAPIGKGQRGLIVAPPRSGKTVVLQQIADAVATNNPDSHLMVVLIDERPEEVTEVERVVRGEVIASTFDRSADDHATVAELVIERAKRLVELGQDVVVLLDSITRLGHAYSALAPATGRFSVNGVDAAAVYPTKRFFGAARNIENGGSLTIIATVTVETGVKLDEAIFEEFKGTGNMELRLSRQIADKRIFPAVDVTASGTRHEERLMADDEVQVTWKIRRALSTLEPEQALEVILGGLKESSSNAEFLLKMQRASDIGGVPTTEG